jgi:hypothetical protein
MAMTRVSRHHPTLAASSRSTAMDTRNFTPEVAETMRAAFERVCRSLGLGSPYRFPTQIAAAKIAHFANLGVHDADELSRAVLKDFKLLE